MAKVQAKERFLSLRTKYCVWNPKHQEYVLRSKVLRLHAQIEALSNWAAFNRLIVSHNKSSEFAAPVRCVATINIDTHT